MDWFEYVDIYCERTAPGLWNEPLNALTNISFILAAVGSWALYKKARAAGLATDWQLIVLTLLLASIGVGSFLFHTHANHWSEQADVLSITLFQLFYLVVLMRRGVRWKIWQVVLGIAAFIGGSQMLQMLFGAPWMYGSMNYAGSLITIGLFAIYFTRIKSPAAPYFLGAVATFTTSLTFRTLDMHICEAFPHGTHFLWHLFNGLLLYLLMAGLVRVLRN